MNAGTLYVNVAPRVSSDFAAQLDDLLAAAISRSLPPATPPKLQRGDKVSVTVTGYIEHAYDDGSFGLVDKRTPFGDGEVDLGCFELDEHTTVRVIESAPAVPKVGDVITGEQIAAIPWRRGTVATTVSPFTGKDWTSYTLTADGDWLALVEGERRYPFAAFQHSKNIRIDYAPGK